MKDYCRRGGGGGKGRSTRCKVSSNMPQSVIFYNQSKVEHCL